MPAVNSVAFDPADVIAIGGPFGENNFVFDMQLSGSFALSRVEPADLPELLSLFLDALILETLDPAGPALELTFLEQLCLEGGDPDFVCRQRFGQ